MSERILKVKDLPNKIDPNTTLEIESTYGGSLTHGFFKYPCKFIPQIPRWAIQKYTKANDWVLDPFAGSGTSLVEAVVSGRNALGVDFDNLSQLLSKTKTQSFSMKQIDYVKGFIHALEFKNLNGNSFNPDLHNLTHWFPEKNVKDLQSLRHEINHYLQNKGDKKVYNFLMVCFASIIKKCSFTDDASPKPYVSTRIKKTPKEVREIFIKTVEVYLKDLQLLPNKNLGTTLIISNDAREIKAPHYRNKVSLAITSPPYINAFDYVRSLRLENAWLGFYGDSNIIEVKKRQIGTETIGSKIYSEKLEETGISKLDSILKMIYKIDKKRAAVVLNYFKDMDMNFQAVNKLLKSNAHYVVVVGDSKIRGIVVPTHEILIDYAKKRGFNIENIFSYIIKNRYLRIPRSGKGGLIKKDWVLDFKKNNGKN